MGSDGGSVSSMEAVVRTLDSCSFLFDIGRRMCCCGICSYMWEGGGRWTGCIDLVLEGRYRGMAGWIGLRNV